MKEMKTTTKDILRAVIVLCAIALVAGLLLGIVYPLTRLTEDEIAKRVMKPLKDIYPAEGYEVVKYQSADETLDAKIEYFFRVKGKENTYIVLSSGEGGYGGEIQMYVVFEANTIVKMEKGQNKETNTIPDSFYEQFYDKDITKYDSFVIGSKDGEIDKVAGSTMSSKGITNAVNHAMAYYKDYLNRDYAEVISDENGVWKAGVRVKGYYENNGKREYRYVKLIITVKNDVITGISDDGSTFSPPQYSPGLSSENLAKYVGKNIKGSKGFTLNTGDGGDIDNEASATGTSKALNGAVNKVVALYNGEAKA